MKAGWVLRKSFFGKVKKNNDCSMQAECTTITNISLKVEIKEKYYQRSLAVLPGPIIGTLCR